MSFFHLERRTFKKKRLFKSLLVLLKFPNYTGGVTLFTYMMIYTFIFVFIISPAWSVITAWINQLSVSDRISSKKYQLILVGAVSIFASGCELQQSEKNTDNITKEGKTAYNATVTRVVDGDTLEVNYKGQSESVRLLLIDTPETVHPQKPKEPFGPEASQYVKDKLVGEKVRIEVGIEERDNYGRLLAYVFIEDETIQEMLLRNGLAATAYLYNDLRMLEDFHAAQQTAIDAEIGVWSIPGYAHVDHNHGFHYQKVTKDKPAGPLKEQDETEVLYDPEGPDRDCSDFPTQKKAQSFMEAAGSGDPHRLDGSDNDGLACENLP